MEMPKRKATRAVGKSQKLQTLWTCERCNDSGMTLMQPNCGSCAHARCDQCPIYPVHSTEKEKKVKNRLGQQQEKGGLYTLRHDAALHSPSTEPQPTESSTGPTCINPLDACTLPTHAAHLQAGHNTPTTFPFHKDSQQSLNQPDVDSIPHPSDSNVNDNSHYVNTHINTQDIFDWSSFDRVSQETAVSSLAPSGGDTDAPAHLSAVARRDDLESRLLSFHPRKGESDPDSDSENSSTSSVATTPTVNRAIPQIGDNKKTHPPPSPNQESQGLACPFWKKDPNRHRKCFKLRGFRRIRDVKQHLRRRHLMPIFCPRCGMQFKDKDQSKNEVQLNKHLQAVDPCHPSKFKKPEGISHSQKELLAKHTARNSGAAAQWKNIWDIVFPSHKAKKPDSAFVYPDQSEDLSSFIDFMQIGGRPLLEGHYATMFNVDGVISVFNKIHDLWRSRRGLPPSIQPARPVSSTSNIHLMNNDAFTEEHSFNYSPSMMTESLPVARGYDSNKTELWSDMDWVIPDLFS